MVDLSQGAIAAIATCATIIATLALCCLPRSAPFFSLRNRVVVVTGGSSGIGKAVALEAARRGAHVVLLARSVQPLVDAVAEIRSVSEASQRILQYSVDVTNEEKTREALKQAAADCGGRVDALVCSAGTSSPREFTATSSAEFESVVRLNLFGTRNAIAAALPLMNGAEGGRVVLISSQAGQVGLYGYTAYSVRLESSFLTAPLLRPHPISPPPPPPPNTTRPPSSRSMASRSRCLWSSRRGAS
jgi:3-dehydrosphinganine reductase